MKLTEIIRINKEDIAKTAIDGEALQAKYYARPLSYLLAWVAIKYKVSANSITYISIIIGLIACICIAMGNYQVLLIGCIVLNFRHILDYVDGTVSRATRTSSKYGKWLDLTFDEILEITIPVSIGIGLYVTGTGLWCLILGFIYASLHSLSALSRVHIELIYGTSPHQFYKPAFSVWYLVYKLGTNLQSASVLIMLPIILIGWLPYYLIVFTFITACELALGIIIKIRSGSNADRK
jgi:phosphatidylglycerophosphate synthase